MGAWGLPVENVLAWSIGWQELVVIGAMLLMPVLLVLFVLWLVRQSSTAGPTAPQAGQLQQCKNCGRPIGQLERVGSFEGRVVCWNCEQLLQSQRPDGNQKRS